MPQEMDNYILGVVKGMDNNVVSWGAFDMLCSWYVITLFIPPLTDGGAVKIITVMAAEKQLITAAWPVIQMHNRLAPQKSYLRFNVRL